MSKKKNLELTLFNGQRISNGEKIQPNVSGVGEHTTMRGTTVNRSVRNAPIYQGYANQRTYLGAVACLNLIYQRALPNFPTSDRSAPSRTVVVYADSRGSVGNTIPSSPLIFHYKEWKIIVVVAKDYKDSAFLQSLLARRDYISAIQHLEAELREKYISANLIPPEIIVSTNTIENFITKEITFQGTSGNIIIPSNVANALTFSDGTTNIIVFDSSTSVLTSNYNLVVNGYLTVSGESTLASITVSDIGANQLVFSENANGSLTGSGNLTFDGSTLALTGSATVSSALTVGGATTLNDDLTVVGNIDHTGNLNITGAITLNGQALTVGSGAVDPNNAVFQDSIIILSDTANGLTFNTTDDVGFMWEKASGSFTGLAWDYSENHFALFSTATEPNAGELSITQYADFKANDLSAVDGAFSGDVSASGSGSFNDLSVGGGFGNTGLSISTDGNVQTDGTVALGSTLDVSGVTNFNDTTSSTNATTGAVIIDGGLGVAENLNIGGDFTATNGTFSSDISANNISATNSVLVGGGFGDVADGGLTLSSNGDIQTDGALTVDGTTTFGNNVTANADLSANNLTTSGATTTNTLSVGGGFGNTGLTVSTDGNIQTDGNIESNDLDAAGDVTVGGDLTVNGTFSPSSLSISSLTPTHITYGGAGGALVGSADLAWNNGTSTLSTVNANFSGESVLASATVSDLTQTRIILAGLNGSLEDSAELVFNGTTLDIGGGQGNTGLSIDLSGNLSTDGSLSGDSITTVGNATVGGDLSVTGDFNPSSITLSGLSSTHILFGGATNNLADSGNLTFNTVTDTFTTVNVSITSALGVIGESTLASATVSDLTQSRITLAGLNGSLEDSENLTFDGTTFSVGSDFTVDQASGNTSVGGTLNVTENATFSANGSFDTLTVGGGFGDVTDGGFSVGSDGAIQTDGGLTVDGVANFNDTTSSTNTTTGAVVIDGGLGVGENVNISGDLSATDVNATNVNATDGDFSGTLTVNDLTINGSFSPTDITVSTLTPTHIVYGSGTSGLVGSGNLTWTDGTSTLTTVNLTTSGNTTLGDTNTDTITANAEFNSSLVASSNTSNLGSSTKSWGTTFTNNLQINFGVNEQFSTITNATGPTTHDCSNGHIFFHNTPTGDFDVVLTNLTLSQSYATTITLLVEQGATGRKPTNTVTLGGTSANILWQGGAPPTPTSSAGSVDVFCLSILRAGALNYIILGQMIEDFS